MPSKAIAAPVCAAPNYFDKENDNEKRNLYLLSL